MRALLMVAVLASMAPAGEPAKSPADEAGAKLVAGVGIGAKGCSVVVATTESTPWGTPRVEVRYEATVSCSLGGGLARDGKFDPEAVKDAAKAAARLVKVATDEHGVSSDRVFVAAASSVAAAPGFEEVAKAVEKATGRPVTGMTNEREMLTAMRRLMPADFLARAVYLDVGAGTMKGGTFVAGGSTHLSEFRSFTAPGVLPFEEAVRAKAKESKKEFAAAARTEGDKLAEALGRKVRDNPALEGRSDVLVQGGCVWALVTLVKPEAALSAYVPLNEADIDAFVARLRKDKTVAEPDLSGLKWEPLQKAAAADVRRVKDTFTADQLLGGVEILRATAAALKLGGKKLYFVRGSGASPWLLEWAVEQANTPHAK